VDPGGTLARRGIRLEMKVAETYGEEQSSILRTAALWAQNVSAFIGPQESCLHEARMAAAFNLPMISYVSCRSDFSKPATKKTLFLRLCAFVALGTLLRSCFFTLLLHSLVCYYLLLGLSA
jgi:hypothetical protein